ncbi:Multidrug resistance-associated protein 4, partial [Phlyctochytrium planicorne]
MAEMKKKEANESVNVESDMKEDGLKQTFPDESGSDAPLFPKRRQESNIWGMLTFSYMNQVIRTGLKRELGPDDFMAIEDDDSSQDLSTKLIAAWEAELLRAKHTASQPQLLRAVWKVFGFRFMKPGLVSLVETFVKIGEALMLGVLLRWFQDPNGTSRDGYLYALGLSGTVFMHAFLHHIEFFLAMRVGMQIRIAFIAAIYKKCLALSISHTSSTGLIVNLVSNDVQRFEDCAPFAHFICKFSLTLALNSNWTLGLGPLEVLLIIYFMYLEIGFAAFAAIAALLALIPIQGGFAKQFSGLRKRTVGFRDERIKSISDSLAGIMIVKLYAWEEPFKKNINDLRDAELNVVRKASVLRALNEAFYFASPAVIEIFAFLTYWLLGGELTPSKIFTCIVYLSVIQLSMTNFYPKALQFLSESKISLQRIQTFLALPEMSARNTGSQAEVILKEINDPDVQVVVENGSFAWGGSGLEAEGSAAKTVLKHINFRLKKGECLAVIGPVGSGKSSLLNALLGEMEPSPETKIALGSKRLAYCTQTPFILSGSIKDNILFGLPYDQVRFEEVLRACAMESDVSLFPDGLHTIIGERGVTLSGGQRARLAHLFENCINGILKGKIRVLVTHQLQFARQCSATMLLENGVVSGFGNYDVVLANAGSSFATSMKEFSEQISKAGVDDGANIDDLMQDDGKNKVVVVEDSTARVENQSEKDSGPKQTELGAVADRLIKKEEVAKGSVPLATYFTFFRSGTSVAVAAILIISLIVGEAAVILTNWYLSKWSLQDKESQRWIWHVVIFLALAIGTLIVSIGRAVLFFDICLNATESIFRQMLASVLRSPMGFFQANPHGRLMNRFSKDLTLSDEMLPLTFFDFIQCFFMIVGTFTIAVAIIPWVLLSVPVITLVFFYLRKYYIATSRQIKRYEAITRSPIYSSIPSTLEGLSTIRAFGNEKSFADEFISLQNENTRMFFCFLSAARWLGFRLDVLSASFLCLVAFLSVGIRFGNLGLNPGVVGLLLSYALQLMGLLQWAVRQSAEVENLMVSVERMLEYTKLEPEAPVHTDVKPPKPWPDSGEIKISGMSLQYPNTERPVLKNITVHIPGGTKVGVVGRTGAGKSSLLQALFRLVEPVPDNAISIDGIPTTSLGLEDLRSRISIIPQEPFCFKGSLRFNLDPFGRYGDEEIWRALEGVELKHVVEALPDKMESFVAENGSNWSLIVMDEATSAVDMRTDALVQTAIRSTNGLFATSTVLTIAHRLQTIIDFDMILVLHEGAIVEYGTPHQLLQKNVDEPTAWFGRMVAETSPENQANLRSIAAAKASEK